MKIKRVLTYDVSEKFVRNLFSDEDYWDGVPYVDDTEFSYLQDELVSYADYDEEEWEYIDDARDKIKEIIVDEMVKAVGDDQVNDDIADCEAQIEMLQQQINKLREKIKGAR